MEIPLERAWTEWDAFCAETVQTIKEASASGLPPPTPESSLLREALNVLDSVALGAFLDDPRLDEKHPEPGEDSLATTRFALLLCFLPPQAALPLAQRYDDPCRAKSHLPPRATLALFFTFRWKAFLLANLRRQAAVIVLEAHRHQVAHFVNRFGDQTSKALLTTTDPPALTRELEKVRQNFKVRQTNLATQGE